MEFAPSDFNRLMIDVTKADMSVPFVKQFHQLQLYSEFSKLPTKTLEVNRIIKWIVYVYDKGSPYRDKYKNLTQRKVQAMMDVGYDLQEESQRFIPDIEDVLMGHNHYVNAMIIAYIKLHCDAEYSHLLLLESMYFTIYGQVLSGITQKIGELEKTKEAYSQAIDIVLMNDKNKGLVAELYKSINSDKIKLRPEDMAKAIKEKGAQNAATEISEAFNVKI